MSEPLTTTKTEFEGLKAQPWLRVIESNSVCNDKGEPNFDGFDFTDKDYDCSHFVIATPNISRYELDDLKRILTRDASNCDLDMGVSISGSLEGEKGKEVDRWELGWDDMRRVSIDVYPKEFFESQPNTKEVFVQKIVPQIAKWVEMDSPSYGH